MDALSAHLLYGHLVSIADDRLQIPQNFALGQHRPILGVQHVEPICGAANQ